LPDELVGVAPSEVVAFRWDGSWSQVPVQVDEPPTAGFTVSPTSPRPGKPVTFTSTSSDPDGAIASQDWDLDGDGQFDDSSAPQTSRTFANAGVYTVSLRVTDDGGATAETTRSIAVCPTKNGPPGCRG
jgi:PKD repeat protein